MVSTEVSRAEAARRATQAREDAVALASSHAPYAAANAVYSGGSGQLGRVFESRPPLIWSTPFGPAALRRGGQRLHDHGREFSTLALKMHNMARQPPSESRASAHTPLPRLLASFSARATPSLTFAPLAHSCLARRLALAPGADTTRNAVMDLVAAGFQYCFTCHNTLPALDAKGLKLMDDAWDHARAHEAEHRDKRQRLGVCCAHCESNVVCPPAMPGGG